MYLILTLRSANFRLLLKGQALNAVVTRLQPR